MNSKSLRRLAADHASLHTTGLPPNYLFPPSAETSDLTSLDVLLAGPVGTPFSEGVWRLHLDIPSTYPTAPPTANFRTRLWHPNIDEASGAVCVETLKRDWSSSLKLKDVLVTISCLLIQPNPASALNETAGKLANEDWDGFCRRAKLMTSIHAPVPKDLVDAVSEAQSRGEEPSEKRKDEGQTAMKGLNAKGKEKAKDRDTDKRKSRLHQDLVNEDEENSKRGQTAEPESDPEEDWIPGPVKAAPPLTTGRDNMLGIKGLENNMQLDSPRIGAKALPSPPKSIVEDDADNNSDPFITVSSKTRHPVAPFSVIRQQSSTIPPEPSASTPEPLKFSTKNPFTPINTDHKPWILEEFSWTWHDAMLMHDPDHTIETTETRTDVKKRLASTEFHERKKWELKKFRQAGYDMNRYNRGDFGPRTGIRRL